MMLRSVCLAGGVAVVLAWANAAWAQPAPWFWWVSKLDGQRVCAQVMPRQGWSKGEGPFRNAQCRPQPSLVPPQR